ncbi:histidinol-phosphate transaminase [uncultured Methanobrevibacter sp.]|uniref:pyridoxal phosphate-dependent aminotransferase n=1 Tax=uncultured Methanobrevibacter sp. TaxID=253161 RepID=UPI0025F5455B|nr:histidinol-phosphate transaminase [uncultured Methanobrevibacter sp.]
MYYINENVKNLFRIFDQNSREGYLRMDLNENPVGLSQDFIDEVLSKVTPEFVAKYPEQLEFTTKLAKFIGVEVENICLVNGSAEGIRYVIQAYSRPGGKILSVSPSYAMYDVYCEMYGRESVHVCYDENLEMNVNNIVDSINDDIDLVIILNPNNPVGDVYNYEDVDKILTACKKHECTLLIDEAYFYFYPNSFLNYALENEHVLLTRTFSKVFSLAGARLGYVVGQKKDIEIVQKLCTPHNVNAFGMAFAEAIIEKEGMLDQLVEKQLNGKKYLIDNLREKGYTVSAKEGNFVFIKPKHLDATCIVKKMKEDKKILIKVYKNVPNLGDCLRVSTGEIEMMDKFIDALEDIDL